MLSPTCGGELTQLLTALRDRTGADVGSVVRYLTEPDTECQVEAVVGPALLACGSRYPVAVSSNLMMGRRGEVLATSDYASIQTYDRPLDLMTVKAGFRAGCTVPLNVGARSIGSLTLSGWDSDWFDDGAVAALLEASHEMVIALSRETLPWTSQRALICHDDMLAAEGLSRLVEVDVGLSVGASVASMDELAELGTDEADLIITDCFVAGQRVDEQMNALRRAGGCGRVVVIASHDTPLNRNAAVRNGVVGYCARGAGRKAVSRALQTVAAGAAFLPSEAVNTWIDPPPVTRREAEVLLLLDRGKQVKEIANALGLSHTTVRGYVRNLLAKLDAHTTVGALHAARTNGLLQSLEYAAAADAAHVRSGL
ncbi:MAG TPA: response regulator transcription factor [Conexibacter sp.]|nr:response regulator transcription factor [Conexibacter sp.]